MKRTIRSRGGLNLLVLVFSLGGLMLLTSKASAFFFFTFDPPPPPPPPPQVVIPPPPPIVTPPPPVEPPIGVPPITTESMPEPASLVTGLVGTGLIGLFAAYRRKRKASEEEQAA